MRALQPAVSHRSRSQALTQDTESEPEEQISCVLILQAPVYVFCSWHIAPFYNLQPEGRAPAQPSEIRTSGATRRAKPAFNQPKRQPAPRACSSLSPVSAHL